MTEVIWKYLFARGIWVERREEGWFVTYQGKDLAGPYATNNEADGQAFKICELWRMGED